MDHFMVFFPFLHSFRWLCRSPGGSTGAISNIWQGWLKTAVSPRPPRKIPMCKESLGKSANSKCLTDILFRLSNNSPYRLQDYHDWFRIKSTTLMPIARGLMTRTNGIQSQLLVLILRSSLTPLRQKMDRTTLSVNSPPTPTPSLSHLKSWKRCWKARRRGGR